MSYFIGPLKNISSGEYTDLKLFLESEIAKAERRIAALRRTREHDPEWQYYDEYAGSNKTINDLINEWSIILECLKDDQRTLEAKFNAPKQADMFAITK